MLPRCVWWHFSGGSVWGGGGEAGLGDEWAGRGAERGAGRTAQSPAVCPPTGASPLWASSLTRKAVMRMMWGDDDPGGMLCPLVAGLREPLGDDARTRAPRTPPSLPT